jgi:MFS family permease
MQPVAEQQGEGQPPAGQGRLRQLVAFLVLNSAVQAIFVSVMTFIPLYMVDSFHISEAVAAAHLSIIHSAGLWAAPTGGYLSDRVGKVKVILTSCFLTGPLIYLLNVAPYGIAFGALLLFLGAFMSVRAPTAESYLIGETPQKYRSTIFGIYYFSGMEVGALLTPAMGALIDKVGFNTSFTIASVSAFTITIICSLFFRRNR